MEGIVFKRKGFGGPPAQFDALSEAFASDVEHIRRRIDAGDIAPGFDQGRQMPACAAADPEHGIQAPGGEHLHHQPGLDLERPDHGRSFGPASPALCVLKVEDVTHVSYV